MIGGKFEFKMSVQETPRRALATLSSNVVRTAAAKLSAEERQRKVQAGCFSPKRELERSPRSERRGSVGQQRNNARDEIPPPTRRELPRSPVPPIVVQEDTDAVCPAQASLHSPPIPTIMAKECAVVPGSGVCDENDVAYLNRIRNIRQFQQLQTQVLQLEKSIKAAAEQKEQFQHQALKVGQDLRDMKAKYHRTVSSLQSLVSTSDGHLPASPLTNCRSTDLSHSHVTQVRKLHQHMAIEFGKTEQKLNSRLLELEGARREVEQSLRSLKKEETSKRELDTLQVELTSLESRLAHLQVQSERERRKEGEKEREAYLTAKLMAEDRLKRIISRCEMYVQRHQMLKEMAVRERGSKQGVQE